MDLKLKITEIVKCKELNGKGCKVLNEKSINLKVQKM